jgi:hypothetical protein
LSNNNETFYSAILQKKIGSKPALATNKIPRKTPGNSDLSQARKMEEITKKITALK